MFWLFALGIIALSVYNTGFRKVLLWGTPVWILMVLTWV